jgi:hypothetical protein
MGHRNNKKKIRKYFEWNENQNTMYGELWDGNTALKAIISKEEKSSINNLSLPYQYTRISRANYAQSMQKEVSNEESRNQWKRK